ncbi:MAG TPA: YIP1 family protein [Thermoanaerobaculia bacterium]|jgi:hypothetical protein|nr:YIP1 family protein [Thermoanaerobaculia bacterium]
MENIIDRTEPAFWHMLLNPAETLASLEERPRALFPIVVAAIYASLVSLYVIQRVGLQRLIEAAIQANASVDTETIIANALSHRSQIVTMQAASAFLGSIVTTLLVALFFWLVVTVVGADTTFKKTLAVVAHVAFFVTAVRETMIALVVTMRRDLSGFNIKNPVGTNLAFFIDSASPAATKVLISLDAITIASLVLTVIGLRGIAKQLSPVAAASIVVVPWCLYVVAGMWLPWLG